ncbi:MAG: radical SAM protein [Proteobacteria bacterium]|nr:radical SAM protein [Pseudomonadota bacterium]
MQQLNFTDHRRALHRNRYVYAVVSRRAAGLSIGINLNPDKACNFDCPYCQVDRSNQDRSLRNVDVNALIEELRGILSWVKDGVLWNIPPFNTAAEHLRVVKDISFAGDGEPTACPQFLQAVSAVTELVAEFEFQDVRLQLLTNATLFHKEKVAAGVELLRVNNGEIWAKLDAGTESWFHRVDGTRFPFARVLKNIQWAAQRSPIVIQSMFHRFGDEEPDDQEVEAWVKRLEDIYREGGEIRLVQVYSVARKPSNSSVKMLEKERLEDIAGSARLLVASLNQKTEVVVYPGVDFE